MRPLLAILISLLILLVTTTVSSGSSPNEILGTIVVGQNCSLQNAILSANTGNNTGGCSGGTSGTDTIFLDSNSIYTLNSVDNNNNGPNGLPIITSVIVIQGTGATIERAANAADFRIFRLVSSGNLTLHDVTIRNGSADGAGWGSWGGCFFNQGMLTIERSTLVNCQATADAAAIYSEGAINLSNSTISGSLSKPSVRIESGTLNATNSSITSNDFGLSVVNGSASVQNSVIAGNGNTNISGNITDLGNNILSGDPKLGPLADNGGPTQTHAPLSGSPVVDGGNSATCSSAPISSLDQRGLSRNSSCDIGAVEQQVVPYLYTSFDGLSLQLYPYTGNHIALLVPSDGYDPNVLSNIVTSFDNAYDYYKAVTGQEPIQLYHYNGLNSIAVVPSTCGGQGSGCGYQGYTGIELKDTSWNILYSGVSNQNEYDQVVFYELGRNFRFFDPKLTYKNPDDGGGINTGYAVFMRFMSMDGANVNPGPFGSIDFAVFETEVRNLLSAYLADTSLTWNNTLRVGQAPNNSLGLGASDLFASFLFELHNRYGDPFVNQIWQEVENRPDAPTTQDAIDNFIISASITANENLADLFANEWRWPLSNSANQRLIDLFGTRSFPQAMIHDLERTGNCGFNVAINLSGFAPNSALTVSSQYSETSCNSGDFTNNSWSYSPGSTDNNGTFSLNYLQSSEGDYHYTFTDASGNQAVLVFTTTGLINLEQVTQLSPNTTINNTTPAYEWNSVPDAFEYQLIVYSATLGQVVINEIFYAEEAGCANGGICSKLASALASGPYTWLIRAWNGNGYGPWSQWP